MAGPISRSALALGSRTIRLALSRSLSLALLIAVTAGCSNKQRLGQYPFPNRSLAVATMAPPYPDVFSSLKFDVDASEPIRSILTVGGSVARQVAVDGARARLDSAATVVDVGGRMGERVLVGASRHMRTVPAADARAADYEIEVRVARYGIVASSWHSQAYFRIDAELWLLDGATGRRIWRDRVRATDAISPVVLGSEARTVGGIVTAIAIANMSAHDMQRVLEGLSDFAADRMVQRLARSLDAARR